MAWMVKRKRLRVGDRVYWPGEIVPEAETWTTLRSYVDAGVLVEVESSPQEAGGEAPSTSDVEPVELDGMTKSELLALSEELGLEEVTPRMTKAEIVEVLRGG